MTEFAQAKSLRDRIDQISGTLGDTDAITFFASTEALDWQRFSFSEIGNDIRRRAAGLLACGVAPGETIAAFLPLSATSYQTLLAAMAVGVVAPLNYLLEADALIDLIRQVGATTLLTPLAAEEDPNFSVKLEAVRTAMPHLRRLMFGPGDAPAGAIELNAHLPVDGRAWPAGLPDDTRRNVVLMLTGGTTGKPKVVPHTEAMYLALFESCAHAQGMLRGDRVLSPLPLFHTSGTLNVGLVPLMAGASIFIPSAQGYRDPEVTRTYWELVRRFGITVGAAVPTALARIASQIPDERALGFRHILSGGAPMPKAIAEAIRKNAGAEVVNGWGMTETCGFSVLNPLTSPRDDTVGFPFPGVEIQIRLAGPGGEASRPAAVDEIGELVVRGPTVITRYLDDFPNAFTADGWLRTGDLARIDAEGHLVITGRVKDIIIRGGHNIDPAVIENAAYQHPDVELAAAIGRPDSYAGEVPILFVELRAGRDASESELLDFVRPRISERAAVPKAIHILSALPLSGPGKISKLQLRRTAARDVLQSEIDAVGGREAVKVEIVDDPRFGTVAEFTELRPVTSEVRANLGKALASYSIATRWIDEAE